MNHPNETAINELVDGTLGSEETTRIEQHLEECAACRQLVADLHEIRKIARSLDVRQPPVRVWPRIERAIKFEGERPVHAGGPDKAGRHYVIGLRSLLAGLAMAAVLVLAIAGALRYVTASRSAAVGDTSASAQASAALVEAELREAESHYDKAIKGLEQIASAEQNVLDSNTAATLQKNLAVIDQAISESRAAIRAQPTSAPARESLLDSFKTKLALLQDTVALINEVRKGNETGAARVVSGLKQKGN